MDPALQPLADQIDFASQRLLGTARIIEDGDLRAESLLPGWTRAHVLAHLANNADALVNLLTWARTGVETPMYASPEAREAGIESPTVLMSLAEVLAKASRFDRARAAAAKIADEKTRGAALERMRCRQSQAQGAAGETLRERERVTSAYACASPAAVK